MKRGLGRDAKPTIDHPSKRNSEEKNKKRRQSPELAVG